MKFIQCEPDNLDQPERYLLGRLLCELGSKWIQNGALCRVPSSHIAPRSLRKQKRICLLSAPAVVRG